MTRTENRKNLLFLDHTPFIGGAQLSLLSHIKNIDKNRFSIHIACSEKAEKIGLLKKYKDLGLKCHVIKYPRLKGLGFLNILGIVTAIKELSKITKQNKIDIITTNTVRTALFSLFSFRKKESKLVWLIRDNSFPKILYGILSRYVNEIIFNSQATRNYYKKDKNTHVVYCGRDIETYSVDNKKVSEYRKKWDKSDNKLIIGYLGRLVDSKGPQVLIEAVSSLGDKASKVLCVIAGTGSGQIGNNEEEIKEFVSGNELSEQIIFVGYVFDPEVVISAFDVLVVPSLEFDSLPSNIIDAMCSGTTVVASRTGGTGEIVIDNKTGFIFEPVNMDALKNILLDIVNSNNNYTEIIKRAKNFVVDNFSGRENSQKLEKIYLNADK